METEQIRREHHLSRLIDRWDRLMCDHFDDAEKAVMNNTPEPDVEQMLLQRQQLESDILKFN